MLNDNECERHDIGARVKRHKEDTEQLLKDLRTSIKEVLTRSGVEGTVISEVDGIINNQLPHTGTPRIVVEETENGLNERITYDKKEIRK